MRYKQPISITHPYLMVEWDFEKNETRPEDVTKGSHKKVWWKCSKEHSWEAVVKNRALKGTGCLICANIARRIPFETICDYFYSYDYSVETKKHEYRGAGLDNIKVTCPNKHTFSISFYHFKNGTRCSVCSGNYPISKDRFRSHLVDHGYSVVSFPKKFNSKAKVFCVCPKGHKINIRWNDFQQGVRCKHCYIEDFSDSRSSVSAISQDWLDKLGIKDREKYIDQFSIYVDGFDSETNTVYEFLGDFWHGNPEVYNLEETNPVNKKSFKQLYEGTFHRFRLLEKAGYKIVYIWEKDHREVCNGY